MDLSMMIVIPILILSTPNLLNGLVNFRPPYLALIIDLPLSYNMVNEVGTKKKPNIYTFKINVIIICININVIDIIINKFL